MPQQRLPFVQTSPRRDSSISDEYSEISSPRLHDPDETQTTECQSSQPRTASINPSAKPRTSWVFSHMPDEDIETKYYNQRTGKEEWRCKHCDKTYCCSGGTAAQPSTLRILLLTVTASQKARHELPKSRIYELFSR
ncbi:hypothetical protein HRG_013155 [Hirsutella rhossiliensis]